MVHMTRVRLLSSLGVLILSAAACGRTETSLGAQYGSDASITLGGSAGTGALGGTGGDGGIVPTGGAAGSAGVAGAAGSAGHVEDGGDADAPNEGGDGAPDAEPDAEPDGGCTALSPEPTTTGTEGPSCAGGLTCAGASCCESLLIPSGEYPMGRSDSGSDSYPAGAANEQPEHTASVAGFYLDRFEVTVGRFRKFVAAYDGTPPADGVGAHPAISGTGWKSAWNSQLPASKALLETALVCDPGLSTWTANAGPNESMPVNCVSWYVAFAFCAWDGGRLPTEAEWEKAAAGADENRLYPWGSEPPTACHAGFGGISPHVAVGSRPGGAGRWGHDDLGGGEWEWALDYWSSTWYSGAGQVCSDCANLTPSSWRTIRGGAWSTFEADRLRGAFRSFVQPSQSLSNLGIRCAR